VPQARSHRYYKRPRDHVRLGAKNEALWPMITELTGAERGRV